VSPLVHFQFANPALSSRTFSPLPFVLNSVISFRSELTLTTQRTTSSNQYHISDKMRLAFCILLILPIFHFALAAPVAVGEMLEVRSNVMGVRKDEMAAWKKRMDDDDDDDDYAASATGGG
jgi:hypothetical protein